MTKIRRWHAAFCVEPDVCVGNDLVPFCRECQKSASGLLQTLMTDESSSILQIPEYEAPGQLNLFWPPSVPYADNKLQGTTDKEAPASQQDDETDVSAKSTEDETTSSSGDSVYTARLSSRQIRLVVLAAAPKGQKNYPIHISLEVHDDLRCPEYDAVSYTWGGENNDYSRTSPLFVGDHWDILTQTKNCVFMLMYLRPTRGLRTLWVDAVCINQNDLKERAIQVGKMQDIYARCSHVWLWLGDDIVCTDLQTPPARYWLHEILREDIRPRYPAKKSSEMGVNGEMPPITISMLLERRYFSRVWVIQELALAPRVLIPVGDVLLHADRVTQQRMGSWERTNAPWLSYMTTGPLERRNLHQILRFTSRSEAADIRDKLFGVLGLARTIPVPYASQREPSLQPDYSISSLHMKIGLVAHLIFNMGRTSLFYAAQGVHSTRAPSWLPKLDKPTDWERTFEEQSETEMDLQRLDKAIGMEWGLAAGPLEPSAMLCRLRAEYVKPSVTKYGIPRPSWNQDWSINCKNGALSLKLIKLLKIASKPTHVLDTEGWGVYSFKQTASLLVNVASRHPLHCMVLRNDEIFVKVKDLKFAPDRDLAPHDTFRQFEGHFSTIMILRKTHRQGYRLVTSTPYISFFTIKPGGWIQPAQTYSPKFHLGNRLGNPVSASPAWQDIGFPRSVADHMKELANWLDSDFSESGFEHMSRVDLADGFLGHEYSRRWRLLPVLVEVESIESLMDNEECRRLNATFSDGFLRITTDWIDWTRDKYGSFFTDSGWEFYDDRRERRGWHPCLDLFVAPAEYEHTALYDGQIALRYPVSRLQSVILKYQKRLMVKELWDTGFLGKDFATFEARLRAEPRPEDYSCIAPFPEEDRHMTDLLEIGSHMIEVSIL